MQIKNLFEQFRIWVGKIFNGNTSRPKIPRKKLQLQYYHAKDQFQTQLHALEQTITHQDLAYSSRLLGEHLLEEVKRFEEYHLVDINQRRLDSLPQPLVHPIDFSMWVLYQMHSYTEEIYHYLKTAEDVDL